MNAEVQAAAKGRGENAEAYRLYLQGRFFHDRMTGGDTAKAMLDSSIEYHHPQWIDVPMGTRSSISICVR